VPTFIHSPELERELEWYFINEVMGSWSVSSYILAGMSGQNELRVRSALRALERKGVVLETDDGWARAGWTAA
jgi:hypothetical protein